MCSEHGTLKKKRKGGKSRSKATPVVSDDDKDEAGASDSEDGTGQE